METLIMPVASETLVVRRDLAPPIQRMLYKGKEKLVQSRSPYGKTGHRVVGVVGVVLPNGKFRFHAGVNFGVKPREGLCGEDGSIYLTFDAGHLSYARAMVVIDQNGDGSPTTKVPHPCGVSLCWIAELAGESGLGKDFPLILSTTEFDPIVVTTLGLEFPHAFDYP